MPAEVDLTIRRVPYEVYSRIERTAAQHGQTVEEFVLEQADHASQSPAERARAIDEFIKDVGALRASIAENGPVLRPGETWKDLAREGLRDA